VNDDGQNRHNRPVNQSFSNKSLKKLNIAIPISRFDSSGGIRVLTVLANGLAEGDYSISFVVPRGQHQPFFPLVDRVNIHIIGPNVGNYKLISGLLKKVQLAVNSPSADVAIANAFMTAYSVRFNKLIGRTKRALYFVQHYEPLAFGEYGRGPAYLKLLKTKMAGLTYRLGLECITNSTWTSKMIEERYAINTTIAPLGVDTKIFYPSPTLKERRGECPLVMTIGNSNPVKRFDTFLEMTKLLQTRLSTKAMVATNSSSLPKPNGLNIESVSPKNDFELAALYRRASVFVSTSAWEGFGLPLLEAMACGTPVITTDSGGIRDFCQDGFNCRIVRSAKAEDLAQAVAEIHSNKDLESRLVQNGLITASQWPWERLIDSFDALLKSKPASS
jgi:glycosyltransferase involved in cell wall biosynthesis